MSSYIPNCGNFGTLPARIEVSEQSYSGNLNPDFEHNKKNQEIEDIKKSLLQGRNTTAFAELFEDLHRYIQKEENSTAPNQAVYFEDAQTAQNEIHQFSAFKPVNNVSLLPSTIPVPYQRSQPYHPGVVHRAHISLVPTGNGSYRTITKRKRKRTIFTTDQVEELEKYFSKKPYVTREERQVLVNRLNIADKAVKIWFQNRRLKNKRDQCESPSSDTVMTEYNVTDMDLDYVESQINEKTDKFGYVTLDDTITTSLVNIIDRCLINRNIDEIDESSTECESSPIYEPISPPDSTKEDENMHWQPHETTQSFQSLLDIQNVIY